MYIEFVLYQDYTLLTYSFHKLETAFIFAAFSISVNDWTSMLYDINEYSLYPFIIRKFSLVVINIIYSCISITNFIFCFTFSDFSSYTNSTIYTIGIFFQIAVSLLLTLYMLSAGLRLSWRIHGVRGDNDPNYTNFIDDISNHNNKAPSQQPTTTIATTTVSSRSVSTANAATIHENNQNNNITITNIQSTNNNSVDHLQHQLHHHHNLNNNNNDDYISNTEESDKGFRNNKHRANGHTNNNITASAINNIVSNDNGSRDSKFRKKLTIVPSLLSSTSTPLPPSNTFSNNNNNNNKSNINTNTNLFNNSQNNSSFYNNNNTSNKYSFSAHRRINYEGQNEFKHAIRNLNIVMATCASCFISQVWWL